MTSTLMDNMDPLSVKRKDIILAIDFCGKPVSERGHVPRM
jgi:hypothetical protein